jgi:hypothetical protein
MWAQIAEHAFSFFIGVGVGLAVSSRYQIVVRKDRSEGDTSP